MGLGQYIKDTRSELHHVAWPTRVQTVVYTILVILVSLIISLYLGFFDFIFTNGMGRVIESVPQQQESPIDINDFQISTTTVGTTTVE